MRIMSVILIVISLLAIGCNRHHSHSYDDNPEISVDPWIPPCGPYYHDHGSDEQPVPEPSTLVLMGGGLVMIYLKRRRKK